MNRYMESMTGRTGGVTTNNHKESTRNLVKRLIRQGTSVNALARQLKGLVDRTTIQAWKKQMDEAVD